MIKVTNVDKGSVGDKAGIVKGDKIISFNGVPFQDVLDIIYAESKDCIEIQLENRIITINKEPYKPLGLEYDESIIITPRHCANKCIFCFIDQMPKGMRDTLYVKDDDYRLSFITGSYITLTNLSDRDIDRIIEYRLSPIYVSIHAYNKVVRSFMIGNKKGEKVFEIIDKFANNNIIMHMQIVLCPDINDGKILDETLEELYKYFPIIKSVSIVPVGLTKYRKNLYNIKPLSKNDAISAIEIAERINKKADNNFCWCSDEMYIKAEKELPNYDYYGNFDQIENGVGMIAQFYDEITNYDWRVKGNYHMITGESFYPILNEVINDFTYEDDSTIIIHKVINNYFGNRVTVTGLITGEDIINQLQGKLDNKIVLIPRVIFKEFEEVTLDGMTKDELENKLKAKIIVIDDMQELSCILSGE